jgi:hypothetical protein
MPAWVKNLTSVGQLGIVAAAIGSVLWLALAHIIDGAAALTAILVITGAGTAVNAATNKVMDHAGVNGGDATKAVAHDRH